MTDRGLAQGAVDLPDGGHEEGGETRPLVLGEGRRRRAGRAKRPLRSEQPWYSTS